MQLKTIIKKGKPYYLNSLLLTTILLMIAVLRDFFPFGDNSLLTIDLSQQYVDFFSLFRHTLLNDPSHFFYSFQKGIGGEMIGLWSYYLMSPFNLIFLLFPLKHFALAITVITYLKLVAMSLSFMFFIRKTYHTSLIPSLFFSLSYCLMSYVVIYLLNIMWLDGLVFLPLIALGLHRLILYNKSTLYVISLAVMLISSYYIGFMVCLFLSFYSSFVISEYPQLHTIRSIIKHYLRFIYYSMISAMLSAFLLIPTFFSLVNSKGSGTNITLNNDVTYYLDTIYSRLFNNSFFYNDIKESSPFLYAGALISVLILFYFFSQSIRKREKIMAIVVFIIFTISYHYEFLMKVWHGGQEPVWYSYRFSFTTSFFMIIIAIKAYQTASKTIQLWQTLALIALSSIFCFYYFQKIQLYPYLTSQNIIVTLAFLLLIILVLQLDLVSQSWREFALLLIVITDLATNSTKILQEFSYVDQRQFNDYTQLLTTTIDIVRPQTNKFYRIHKNYARTKNEAFFGNYYGLDNFSSTIETSSPILFGHLGLPDTSASTMYSTGTIFTDDLFAIRYLLEPNSKDKEQAFHLSKQTTDLDLPYYPIVQSLEHLNIHQNYDAFGLGIEVSNRILDNKEIFKDHLPITNQEALLSLIDFNGNGKPYFKEQPVQQTTLEHLTITDKADGNYYTYQSDIVDVSIREKGIIHYQFETTSNNPYYFTLPSQLANNNVELTLDNQPYYFADPFTKRQIIPAAFNQKDMVHQLDVTLLKPKLQINPIYLYEFDLPRYQKMMEAKKDYSFNTEIISQTKIRGTIIGQQKEGILLLTIPYDTNWQAKVNGKPVQTHAVLNDTLMAIPISQGNQIVELEYFPKSMIYGTIISILGLIIWSITLFISHKTKKRVS